MSEFKPVMRVQASDLEKYSEEMRARQILGASLAASRRAQQDAIVSLITGRPRRSRRCPASSGPA